MSKTILIAPDSFKECRNSTYTANLIYKFLIDKLNYMQISILPLSDGGDGFLDSLKNFLSDSHENIFKISDDNGNNLDIPVLIAGENLFIESANVIGLKLVPPANRDPLYINTSAMGKLLKQINNSNLGGELNIKKVTIGIGGTATNDFALGMLGEFGLKIFDDKDKILQPYPYQYNKAVKVIWDKPLLSFSLSAVIDVNSPLTGKSGSAYMFAEQKGADPDQIVFLEESFKNLLKVFENEGLINTSEILPGAGGGLAAGMKIFLGAEIINSYDFLEQYFGIKEFYDKTDYLITGEGRFDRQSFYGKTTGFLIQKFKTSKIFLICGTFSGNKSELPDNVRVLELMPLFGSKDKAIANFDEGIRLLCLRIAENIISEKF